MSAVADLPAVRGLKRSGRARLTTLAVLRVAAGVALVALLVSAYEIQAARGSARAGERALDAARADVRAGDVDAARRHAERAARLFARTGGRLRTLRSLLGPLTALGPVDDQLDAADGLAAAGRLAATAVAGMARTGADALKPRRGERLQPIAALRDLDAALTRGLATLDGAAAGVGRLRGAWLIPPLADAGAAASRRLAAARAEVASARDGIGATIAFAGGAGPRRYLVLSQNPAELRPTGGFIGTYGVREARDGVLRLTRYRSIESWYFRRRHAVVAAERAPLALRLPRRPVAQTLANVNATADWPTAARLAARLWRRGGERPVDGVISLTPDLLARVLRAIGPVRVRGVSGAITSANVIAALETQTHTGAQARRIDRRPFGSLVAARERKRFVGLLAEELVRRLRAGPARPLALARAVAGGLDAREAMAWSADDGVQRVLRARRWDGTLPRVRGDFFYDGEFQYAVKVGRGLRRTFDHDVTLRADGSARIATTVTVSNVRSDGMDSHSYMTLYGPEGAYLLPNADPPTAIESPLAGHPAAGWLRTAPAWGRTRVRVVWEVPRLLVRRPGNRLVYRLLWIPVPAHRRDVLRLRVTPPPGWRWARKGPVAVRRLTHDVRGAWSLVPAS